jgi:predicted SAM-dependent methyltransferase
MFDNNHKKTYDLIVSIQVFEHLENPRELFKTMCEKLNPDGAIYISVPFVEHHQWKYLWKADVNPGSVPPDVFCDNDVHITHFSIDGMKRMGMSFGAREAEYWVSKDVVHNSPGSYHGLLFRF